MKCKECHKAEATECQGRYCETCAKKKTVFSPLSSRLIGNLVVSLAIAVSAGYVAQALFGMPKVAALIGMLMFIASNFSFYVVQNPPQVPDFQWHMIRGTAKASVTFNMPFDMILVIQRLAAERGLSESQLVVEAIRTMKKDSFTLIIGELKGGVITDLGPRASDPSRSGTGTRDLPGANGVAG